MIQWCVLLLWLLGYLAKSKADLSKNPGKAQVNRPTLLRSLFTLGLLCKQFDFDSDVKPKNEVSSMVLLLLKLRSTIWLQPQHKKNCCTVLFCSAVFHLGEQKNHALFVIKGYLRTFNWWINLCVVVYSFTFVIIILHSFCTYICYSFILILMLKNPILGCPINYLYVCMYV